MRGLWHGVKLQVGGLWRAGLAVLVFVAGVLVWSALAGGTQPYETYESTVAADGPVAQYRFDDAVGSGTLADSAGSYTASNSGIVLGGEGPFGGSKSGAFGGEAFATLPSDPLAGASAFTAEGWVDWVGGTSYKQPVFDFGSSSTNYLYLTPASALSGHKMLFEIHTAAGGVAQVTATKLTANAWKYLAITETSSGTLTLYLNGEQVGQTTGATISPASLGSAPEDYLGKPLASGEPLFDGTLSNVAFYTEALTAGQILAHYNAAEFPVNTVAPTITGTPKDGDTLTAHTGTWSGLTPITFSYQWTRCNTGGGECVDIPAASETKYVLGHEDVGRTLRVVVGASDSAGNANATSAQTGVVAAIKPSNTALPVVSGITKIGQLLTASTGSWSGSPVTSYAYQWQTCNNLGARCANITGATSSTYRLIPYDIADTIRVIVTATNSGGSASATSELTGLVAFGEPVNVTPPSVSGTARDGQTLTATSGSWAGTEPISYAYQWQTCNSSGESCTNISGATSTTYLLSPSNVGSTIRVLVTANNAIGHTSEPSPATAVVAAIPPSNTTPPSITGTTVDGQTLTASTGAWSGTPPLSYAYQWERCNSSGESCASISGATGSTYTLTDADVGDTLRVTVTASNSGGSASATSAASGVVLRAPSSTAAPVVSGTAQQGQTLTASTGTWVGTEPITYVYQWESCNSLGEGCLDVSGATASTYTLAAGDVGNTLRVTVTASNTAGSASATSSASAAVSANSTCTDTWTGASTGSWQTASNWSTGSVPVYSDVACVGAGVTVRVTEGANQVGVLVDAGSLDLLGGSLELASGATPSRVGYLELSNGILAGFGTLEVTGGLLWGPNGQMTGSGATVLKTGASGEISAASESPSPGSGCEPMGLIERPFVNEGTLTFVSGTLLVSEGAKFTNSGTFLDNSQSSCFSAQIKNQSGVGAAPTLLNTGTIAKTSGTGTSTVAIHFSNQGHVEAQKGTLNFSGGGVPGEAAVGSWSVQSPGVVKLGGGTFLIGEEVDLSAVHVQGATIVRVGPPSSSSAPVVSGEPFVGQTLTASTGTWGGVTPISYAYQWLSCNASGEECAEIPGATSASFALVGGDAGRTVQVLVTATNRRGSTSASSQPTPVVLAPVAPSNTVAPVISGEPVDGQTLSASPGEWAGTPEPELSFQWEQCNSAGADCSDIAEATGSTLFIEHREVGGTLRVTVRATSLAGATSSTSAASGVVAPLGPVNISQPVISGPVQVGEALAVSTGEWRGTPPLSYAYQWQSCDSLGVGCVDIRGATSASYEPGESELGDTLQVIVTATNSAGSSMGTSEVTSAITPAAAVNTVIPVVSGVAQVGQTLSADTGSWESTTPVSYAYQWQGCSPIGENCANIPGATAPTYTLGRGEEGGTLQIVVTASNAGGDTMFTSEPTAVVVGNSGEPACTDLWIGGNEGAWREAQNWSLGIVPGATDVACAGAWDTLQITTGSNKASSVYAGSLAITGGSLELADAAETSSVGALTLQAATLKGAGTLAVSGSLTWSENSEMSGSGATVLRAGATGAIEASSSCRQLALLARSLVNEGTLTFSAGTLMMSNGAKFENKGTFSDNSEAECYGPQIEVPSGASSAPQGIANTGIYQKTAGSGTGVVAVPFSDEGQVIARSGKLEFTDGGLSQVADGSWSTEGGASIVLGGGSFLIGEAVDLSAVSVEGATVARAGVLAPASSALPVVSGQPVTGQVLSASSGGWSGTPPFTYTYQWQLCSAAGGECAVIEGATSSTYTLPSGDAGRTLDVLVTASNPAGSASATSAVTSMVIAPAAPSNTSLPTISGTAQAGQTLVASTGIWSGAAPLSYSYQWERCNAEGTDCAVIEGATGTGYELREGDIDSTLRVKVTATDASGSTTAVSVASAKVQAEPVSEIKAPTISGTPNVEDVLSADAGQWAGTSPEIGYQWESCSPEGAECHAIEGATGSEYDLAAGDTGSTLRVRVGASNARDALSDVSPATPVIGATGALANSTAPSITGEPQKGHALTAETGSWSGTGTISYAYQWQTCSEFGAGCEAITGATTATYTPGTATIGHALRVLVTASDETGSRSRVSPATQPVAVEHAPLDTEAPAVSGIGLVGQTLSASTGAWSGAGPIVYSYQWERCNQSEQCTAIEGATASTYTLTSGDVGSTVVVLVSAANTSASATAVSNPTATIEPEAITALSTPSITGVVQLEGTLTADAGIWSANGALAYGYQWERCNTTGSSCAAIEGATGPSHLVGQADLGATLRVKVTLTNPLGNTTAYSPHTVVVPGGEASVTEAIHAAESVDPALLAPSSGATVEEQTVSPALADGEEGLSATSTPTSASVSKENPGEFAVNTSEGEISLTPQETSAKATATPTIVNGAAAFFTNTWPATDTIVRPDPLGATTLLQLRSAEAPTSFSWAVGLGANQELRQLSNGAVAVIDTTEAQHEPTAEEEASGEPEHGPEGESEVGTEEGETEENQPPVEEPEVFEEESHFTGPPSAPLVSTVPGEAPPGQLQPQNTQASYEAGAAAMSTAEAQTEHNTLMVIPTPVVKDASSHTVPASLSTHGNIITLTVTPGSETTYPILVDPTVATTSDTKSKAKAPKYRYGISDQQPENLDHSGIAPEQLSTFDPRLRAEMHINTARLIIPYNVMTARHTTEKTEWQRLVMWLQAAGKEHLEPYITLGTPCFLEPHKPCSKPSAEAYRRAVTPLITDLTRGRAANGLPAGLPRVKTWGAWNEPDLGTDPLNSDPVRAAGFWDDAKTVLSQTGCSESVCKMVAGEFADNHHTSNEYTYELRYRKEYAHAIIERRAQPPTRAGLPHIWGLHDYHDVVYGGSTAGGDDDTSGNRDAEEFVHLTDTKELGHPYIWLSEQGVQLQDGRHGKTRLKGHEALQRSASFDFLHLQKGLTHIERINYYSYSQPPASQIAANRHAFDSGLVTNEHIARPAYCVLAFAKRKCPPTVKTELHTVTLLSNTCQTQVKTTHLTGEVNPNGRATTYFFQYGPNPGLGYSTTPETLEANRGPVQVTSEVALHITGGGLGCAPWYYRLVTTNGGGEATSSNGINFLETIFG